MNVFRIFAALLLAATLTMAADTTAPADQPALTLQPSSYVEFTGSAIVAAQGTIAFEATFIVLGEGIFGHFDMVAYNDSGKVLLIATSTGQTYRRDRGPNIKTVRMEAACTEKCSLAEVSFHETRLEPDAGACKKK